MGIAQTEESDDGKLGTARANIEVPGGVAADLVIEEGKAPTSRHDVSWYELREACF